MHLSITTRRVLIAVAFLAGIAAALWVGYGIYWVISFAEAATRCCGLGLV